MRCGAKCAGVIFRIIGEKHPQMKTDVVGQSVGAGLKLAPIMVVQDV